MSAMYVVLPLPKYRRSIFARLRKRGDKREAAALSLACWPSPRGGPAPHGDEQRTFELDETGGVCWRLGS